MSDLTSILEQARSSTVIELPGENNEPEEDLFSRNVKRAMQGKRAMVIALVTSRTEGLHRSEMVPFGAGKSTLAMHLSFHYNHYDQESGRFYDSGMDKSDLDNWKETNGNLWYEWKTVANQLNKAKEEGRRLKAGVWDDVQGTAGAQTGFTREMKELRADLTRARTQIGVLFLTAPSQTDIAKIVRDSIQFLFIVHTTGHYEIQHVTRHLIFKNGREESKYEYVADDKFGPLPGPEQSWYDRWRAKHQEYKSRGTEKPFPEEETDEDEPKPEVPKPKLSVEDRFNALLEGRNG